MSNTLDYFFPSGDEDVSGYKAAAKKQSTTPVWLVYNGYGDAVICRTRTAAEKEAEDIDSYRAFFFGDCARRYICVIMKCTMDRAKAQIELLKERTGKRKEITHG